MKKNVILKLGLIILIAYLLKPNVIYSQSSCQTSIQLSQQTNYELTHVQTSDTEIWASFIATSSEVMCIADSVSGLAYNKVKKIELYQGDCNSKAIVETSSNFESSTMQSLYFG